MHLGVLSVNEFKYGDLVVIDSYGMTFDTVIECIKEGEVRKVVPPYRWGRDNFPNSKIMSNFRQALWRANVEVVGFLQGNSIANICDYSRWLDNNGFPALWGTHGLMEKRGKIAKELEIEGKRWNQLQYLLAPKVKGDLDTWPFPSEWVDEEKF